MKVQVVCPAGSVTGGPEAMHQFAHMARHLGADACMVYIDSKGNSGSTNVPAPYRIYGVPVDLAIEDHPSTLVLISETDTHHLPKIKRAKKSVWWLSVDNYFADLNQRKKKRIRWWTGQRPLNLSRPDDLLHLAQSAYARAFLKAHGRDGALMLTDYLREDFIAQASAINHTQPRAARIAFNPKKGWDITQRILEQAPSSIEFVRLENMTPTQVIETLQTSAVYMDFGHHPGRDRFPREAALCGCCIVTGRRGSADFHEDVPIPEEYKLDDAHPDFLSRALNTLDALIHSYGSRQSDFSDYRKRILDQKALFKQEVAAVLAAAC
jgi:hypothetical protein